MSDQPATETTPLLEPEAATPSAGNALAKRALAFRIATTASLVTSILTLIFTAACTVLLSRSPPTYNPPYQIYFNLAPSAGFAVIICLHSALVLLDGAPLRGTIAGILVDIFGGLFFLFQSLLGMQQVLQQPRYGYTGCRPVYGSPPPSLSDCEKWRARVEPVIWTYLAVSLALGFAHVALFFIRTAAYKRDKVLRVQLVGEDGNSIRR